MVSEAIGGRSSPPSRHPVRTGSHEGDAGEYGGGDGEGDKFFDVMRVSRQPAILLIRPSDHLLPQREKVAMNAG